MQVTSLAPRQIFRHLVRKYNGDYRVREFNSTNQLKYEIVSCNFNYNPSTDVHGDLIIRLAGYKSRKDYPKDLRLIDF